MSDFDTQLTPEEEAAFQTWASRAGRLGDLKDYDLRGYWKANGTPAPNGHFTDQFKKPNHPTFSDESQYSGAPAGYPGGHWDETSFSPSPEMLSRPEHRIEDLRRYMVEAEPDITLQEPAPTMSSRAFGPPSQSALEQQLAQAAALRRRR